MHPGYLLDMLTEYGYADEAYRLMTREEYPSFGYMIQQEATTIWERFELKKNPGMNSHNHPMYGAAGAWFFTGLAGIRPTAGRFQPLPDPACLSPGADEPAGLSRHRAGPCFGQVAEALRLPAPVCGSSANDHSQAYLCRQSHALEPGSHHLSAPLDESSEIGQKV